MEYFNINRFSFFIDICQISTSFIFLVQVLLCYIIDYIDDPVKRTIICSTAYWTRKNVKVFYIICCILYCTYFIISLTNATFGVVPLLIEKLITFGILPTMVTYSYYFYIMTYRKLTNGEKSLLPVYMKSVKHNFNVYEALMYSSYFSSLLLMFIVLIIFRIQPAIIDASDFKLSYIYVLFTWCLYFACGIFSFGTLMKKFH